MNKIILIIVIFLCTITFGRASSNSPDIIVENGYTYVLVKTKGELKSLGITIVNGTSEMVKGGPKRGKRKKGCSSGKGTCKASFDDGEDGDEQVIGTVTFEEQYDADTGELIPAEKGLKAYYNAEIDEVIFR